MGRPEKWNKAERTQILNELVQWLTEGKTMRSFCRQDGMPKHFELYRWIDAEGEEIQSRIARAREAGYDVIAEQALSIADGDDEGDEADTVDDVLNKEDRVARDRLRFDARMKLLSKWASGRYGDKLQVEQGGSVTFVVDTGVPVSKAKLTLTPAALPLTGSD